MKIMMLTFRRIATGLALGCVLMFGLTCHGQRLSTGYNFSFSICADSSVMAWGQNASSQLGTPAINYAEVPINVGLDQVIAIDGGVAHTLALRADSTVWVWGENGDGQLGLGFNDTISRDSPTHVTSLSGIVAISAGAHHSMALGADSTVWVWGNNDQSQLGDGTIADRSIPQQVSGPTGIVAISAGGYFSVALGVDGRIWAWGSDTDGQIGDGLPLTNRSTPVLLTTVDSVVAISAGEYHVLALDGNGKVWAWGFNIFGQLGLNNLTNQDTPSLVPNSNGTIAVAAGSGHSLIMRQNGTVWATGRNHVGQLGLGNTQGTLSFTQIGSGFTATAIVCGEKHSLAITPSGSCVGWGSNILGAVGNGTKIDQVTPSPIIGLCPTDFAVPDPVVTNYFRPTVGAPGKWIAGELASSLRLMDGRMLWIFGKSYLDSLGPNNDIPCNRSSIEIDNCLLVQGNLNPDTFITCLDTTVGQASRAFFQPEPGTSHFVPGHGYQDDADSATIFLSGYAGDTLLGTWAARIGIVTMTVLDISRIIPVNMDIDFGTAVIVDSSADQLYLYGSKKHGDTIYPYLSRRVLSDPAAAWEFATLAGTGWSPQIADARPISPFPVSARYSVTSLQGHHYLITQNPEPNPVTCRLQRNILAYKSDSLKGPFESGSFLATSQDTIAGFPVFAFNAYAHPDQHALGFSRCDSLLVSYNLRDDDLIADSCSMACMTQTSQDADAWRPQFLRVPYSLIDTALSTATVASFTWQQDGMNWIFHNTSQFATTFSWSFGGGATSTDTHPVHPFPHSGSYPITLIASGCGSSDTIVYPIVHQDSPTPIVSSRFTVFPQPSRGPVHIQGENLARGPVRFELYTLLGEMIAQETHTPIDGHLDAVLQCQPPAGMYLLRIATQQSSACLRIVRQ